MKNKIVKIHKDHFPSRFIYTSWNIGDIKNSVSFIKEEKKAINPFTKQEINSEEMIKDNIKAEGWIQINSGEWLGRKIRLTLFPSKQITDLVERFKDLASKVKEPKFHDDHFYLASDKDGKVSISYVPDYKKTQYFENGQDIPKIDDPKMSWFLERFPEKIKLLEPILNKIKLNSHLTREELWSEIQTINKITSRNVYEKVSMEELLEKTGLMINSQNPSLERLEKIEQKLLLQLDEIRIEKENLKIKNSNVNQKETVKIDENQIDWLDELE